MCTHLRQIKPNIQAAADRRGRPLEKKCSKHAAIRSVWLLTAGRSFQMYFQIFVARACRMQLFQLLSNSGRNFAVVSTAVGDEDFAVDTRSYNPVTSQNPPGGNGWTGTLSLLSNPDLKLICFLPLSANYSTYLFRQRLCSRLTALWRYINFVLLLLFFKEIHRPMSVITE